MTKISSQPEKTDQPTQPLILLAEDSEANIEAITGYLEATGHRLIVARDGEEALRLIREKHPDLILMDIQMPGVDGFEAIRRIRADMTLENTPIIALTALAMPGDADRCLEAGADHYLSKPVRLRKLVEIIKEILQQRS
jgi:CheY-like chemotaxis protein